MTKRTFENKTTLITGADGGIGTALIKELVKRNITKVYATGISADRLNLLASGSPDKIVPVVLDVTNEDSVNAAAEICNDADIIINNAGIELKSDFIGENAAQKALFEMKVNYIGVINMINSFLPSLKQKNKSYILNILSVGSTAVVKRIATYCASKSATHILTQSLRSELNVMNIDLIGVYPGYVDTSMSADVTTEKITPESLAVNICNDFENGLMDIFPDKMSTNFYNKKPIAISYLK